MDDYGFNDNSYWDDVYFEEHRDNYSGSFGGGKHTASNSMGQDNDTKLTFGSFIMSIIIAFGYFFLLVILILLGLLGMFIFPPLGMVFFLVVLFMLGVR